MKFEIPENLKKLFPVLPYHNLRHTESFNFDDCPSLEAFWAAVFHDIVYDPHKSDNEENSLTKFAEYLAYTNNDIKVKFTQVEKLILSTKDHIKLFDPNDKDMVWLHRNDLRHFRASGEWRIAKTELAIFKEYQFAPVDVFKTKRLQILNYYKKHPLVSESKIDSIIQYLNIWQPNIGLFCGSFDPFHRGHLDILRQADKVFDKVIVAQGKNEDKDSHTFDLNSVDSLKYHEKITYNSSLIDLVDRLSLHNKISVIRGLRNYHDLHDESGLFNFVSDYSKVPFVYFISKSKNLHISSGAIRKLINLNQDVSKYLS